MRKAKNKQQSELIFPARLTERYRPERLVDFIGMERPKKVFQAFAQNPRSEAFLLWGPSGLGKTSMALALAKEIGAEIHHIASQQCTVDAIQEVSRRCWYVPMGGRFHVVLVDEADRMTNLAQLALLSKLDATEPSPNTIWIFTCNETSGLERRFLSRCKVLEFDRKTVKAGLSLLLRRVWRQEAPATAPLPDFDLMANFSGGNVRDAMNNLELEVMAL